MPELYIFILKCECVLSHWHDGLGVNGKKDKFKFIFPPFFTLYIKNTFSGEVTGSC